MRESFIKNTAENSIKGGGLVADGPVSSRTKMTLIREAFKKKDDQNGLIHPEK